MPDVRKRLDDLASTYFPAWTPAEVDDFYTRERAKQLPVVRQAIGKS